jgi:hypothetical protein
MYHVKEVSTFHHFARIFADELGNAVRGPNKNPRSPWHAPNIALWGSEDTFTLAQPPPTLHGLELPQSRTLSAAAFTPVRHWHRASRMLTQSADATSSFAKRADTSNHLPWAKSEEDLWYWHEEIVVLPSSSASSSLLHTALTHSSHPTCAAWPTEAIPHPSTTRAAARNG